MRNHHSFLMKKFSVKFLQTVTFQVYYKKVDLCTAVPNIIKE